jgi:hypothetical protein
VFNADSPASGAANESVRARLNLLHHGFVGLDTEDDPVADCNRIGFSLSRQSEPAAQTRTNNAVADMDLIVASG